MANVLSDDKKQQVIALGQLGWSLRRIQQATGVRRETAGSYLRAAGIALRPTGWPSAAKPAMQVTTDSGAEKAAIAVSADPNRSKPAIGVTTDSDRGNSVCASACSACEPYREAIELGLARGRNAVGIWQDSVDQNGFAGGYQSVKRFVRRLRGKRTAEARAVIVTAPGEEAQVDYGTGPMVRDPHSGKYRRTRLFVMTLGYSRKSVRLLVFGSSSRVWAELHEKILPPIGRRYQNRRSRQLRRRCPEPRHPRSHAQSPLSRRAGALRRRGHALPRP